LSVTKSFVFLGNINFKFTACLPWY
jgi:hypothetical protein